MPKDIYLEQVQLARSVFETLPPMPEVDSLQLREVDQREVSDVLDKYGLRRYTLDEVDYSHLLSGNYFADNPAAV